MRDKKRSNFKKEIAAAIASAMMITGVLSGSVGTMVTGAAQDGSAVDGGAVSSSDKAAEDAAAQAQAEADAAAQAAAAQAAAESEAAAQAAAQAAAESEAAAQAAAQAAAESEAAAQAAAQAASQSTDQAANQSGAEGTDSASAGTSGDGNAAPETQSAGESSGLISEGQGDTIVIGDNTQTAEQQTETQTEAETETETETETESETEEVQLQLLVYPANYPIIFLTDVTEVPEVTELTKMKKLKKVTEENLFAQIEEDEDVLKALSAYSRLNPDEPKLKKVYVPAGEQVQFVINEDMAQQQWKDAHKGVKDLKPLEFEDFNKKKDDLKIVHSDNKDKHKLDVTEEQDIYSFTMDEDYAILKIKKYISPEEQAAIDAAEAEEAAARAAELEASGETETETEGTVVTALDGVTQIDLKPEVASLLNDKKAAKYLENIAKAGKEAKEGVDDVITIGDTDPANVPAGEETDAAASDDGVIIIGTDESDVDIMGGAEAGDESAEAATEEDAAATEEATEAVTEAESETELDLSKLTFRSSDEKVAKVEKNGQIKAVGTGTCTIYAYEGDVLKSQVTITIQ